MRAEHTDATIFATRDWALDIATRTIPAFDTLALAIGKVALGSLLARFFAEDAAILLKRKVLPLLALPLKDLDLDLGAQDCHKQVDLAAESRSGNADVSARHQSVKIERSRSRERNTNDFQIGFSTKRSAFEQLTNRETAVRVRIGRTTIISTNEK